MDRFRLSIFSLFCISSSFCGCSDNQDVEGAKLLIDRIEMDDYQSWERAPGFPDQVRSSAPHGDRVEIFVNDAVTDALDNESDLEQWPNGSIIAKRGYDDGKFKYLAIMEKVDEGEWFWVEEIGGTIKFSGKPDVCTNCHSDGDDFVLAFPLP